MAPAGRPEKAWALSEQFMWEPVGREPGPIRPRAMRQDTHRADREANSSPRIPRSALGQVVFSRPRLVSLRLCLERIAPVRKGRPIALALPTILTSADVTTAMSAIILQMAEGDITPEEAAVAASVIETKRKALETEELDRRLIAIEQQEPRENSYDDTIEVPCFRRRGEGRLAATECNQALFRGGLPYGRCRGPVAANGRHLSVPHRIVAFVHVFSPLVDITDNLPRMAA